MEGPTKIGLIQEIEDIQKSFIRKIHCQNHGDFWGRLGALGLYSLQKSGPVYIQEMYGLMDIYRRLQMNHNHLVTLIVEKLHRTVSSASLVFVVMKKFIREQVRKAK